MTLAHLDNLIGHRLNTLPLLVLYLTDGCNSRCGMCDIWRRPRKNMDMALVDELVSAAADLKMRWVLLSGGEAMQHPEWPTIARRFREVGIYTMLLTNGLLVKRQAEAVAASVDELIVSLDGGTPETYAHIRGVDAFDLLLEGITQVRAAGVPVTTRTTVQAGNYGELPQIIEAAYRAGASLISFLPIDMGSDVAFGSRTQPQFGALSAEQTDDFAHIIERIIDDYAPLFEAGRMAEPPPKLRRLVGYFRALGGQPTDYTPPRCNAPHISTVIEVDGTLRPCYFLPATGNAAEAGLSAALNTPAAVAMRRAYQSGQRAECARCVCPLYKGPRALARM